MIASSIIHTIKTYGPDRVTGFSPIPAMSMVSYSGGTRFLSLIGGNILSFYDWYADLPPASPQVGASRRMCRKAETGTTRNTSLFGERTSRRHAHRMLISWLNRATTGQKLLVSVRTMQNMKSLPTCGCRPEQERWCTGDGHDTRDIKRVLCR